MATFNAGGLQSDGMWGRFLDALLQWSRRMRVGAVFVQEHNLNPQRDAELRAGCADRGMTLTIAYRPAGPDGVHRGGVLLLTFDAEVAITRTVEVADDLVRVVVEMGGESYDLAGVYVPAPPGARVDMLGGLKDRLGPRTIAGGDWNCVEDVTLDVQSTDPLAYANVGANLLADAMTSVGLYDVRREQLQLKREPTRLARDGSISTRLDRWYVPMQDDMAHVLWSVSVNDHLTWKDKPSDHLPVVLSMEPADGERGHERKTIREDLVESADTQELIRRTVTEAYDMGGSSAVKWVRAHNTMRHQLMKLTDAARKRDAPKILATRSMLEMLRGKIARQGPSDSLMSAREGLLKELRSLEQPEIKLTSREEAKRAEDRSDRCTAATFRSYRASAMQQMVNELKKVDEWEEGTEPNFVGTVSDPRRIPNEAKKYYEMLFAEKQPDEQELQSLMRGLKGSRITEASRDKLEAPVSKEEIQAVMEKLPLGKQAGPDRIPNAVYKYMSKFFAGKLADVLREARARGRLPAEFLKGDIGLLHKKDDRDEIRNYRPITLLQGAYKIYTRVLAKRMAGVVHEFVSESQKGFVPHTFIGECSMLLNLIEAYVNDDCSERGGIFLFLDMEKAFDRVSYDYLLRGLDSLGFGPEFVGMVSTMYNKEAPPQRRIYMNGYYSDWFSICSGVAQGCPLSPLLFLVVAQGLKLTLAQEGVRGITINGREYTLSQFADDTTVILRDKGQLRPMTRAINRWCRATCMRENLKKREGLAMGKLRTRPLFTGPCVPLASLGTRRPSVNQICRSIKWAGEGDWVISLGVPIGNDLDHDRWWRKKIQAVRNLANRWAGLYSASYFGRNLVVQALYFGRYRYWLWSLPMSRNIMEMIQSDADRMWWSRDPILDGNRRRVKRFQAKHTAIGPRSKGGLNNMVWAEHVRGMQARWIMRYLHPARAAWKYLLDDILLKNAKGEWVLGGGREILMCSLSARQRIGLLLKLPRRAAYIRGCLRAHWKVGYTQDLQGVDYVGAENLWHNPRFTLEVEWRVRHYFVNVLDLTQISDIVDYESGEPFDDEQMAVWVRRLHMDVVKKVPKDKEVDQRVLEIRGVIDQIPGEVLQELRRVRPFVVEEGTMLALIRPDGQDEDSGVIYARVRESEEVGTRYEVQRIDAVGIPHPEGFLKAYMDRDQYEVVWWGDRVIGPAGSTFPRPKGWSIDGVACELPDVDVKMLTKAFTMRSFKPPTAEEGWDQRLDGVVIPWREPKGVWRLRTMYVTPRDWFAMVKLLRRNLFTAARDPECDGTCWARGCRAEETQKHLGVCRVIREEYWGFILRTMVRVGFAVPTGELEIVAFLVTGRITDSVCAPAEQSDMLVLGWRCLYAETVRARLKKKYARLEVALARWATLLASRVTRYGMMWERLVATRQNTSRPVTVPPKVREKLQLIKVGYEGDFRTCTEEIKKELVGRCTEAGGGVVSPQVTMPTGQPLHRPMSVHPPSSSEEDEDALIADRRERDRSGDARRYKEGGDLTRTGAHPPGECNLAVARNLLKDERLPRLYLEHRQVGARVPGETRYPDWARILEEKVGEGEVVLQFRPELLPPAADLSTIRVMTLATEAPNHVTLYEYSHEDMYNFFDNESTARITGWSQLVHRGHMRRAGVATVIMQRDTLLHVQVNNLIIAAMRQRRVFDSAGAIVLDD